MRVFLPDLKAAGLLAALACCVVNAAAQPPPPTDVLTNAAQVRNLTTAQAAQALPVRLTGVMIDSASPSQRTLILADQTAAMYVRANQNLFAAHHRGELLEIKGVTDPGQFAPIVIAKAVRKLGTAEVPAAQPATYQQLITGALDGQWVEIKGVVRQYFKPPTNAAIARLILSADGGLVPVRFTPKPSDTNIQVDAEVQVQAVCFYQFSQKRQVLSPVLQVPNGVPVRVEKTAPDDPYAAPLRSATSLLQFSPESIRAHAHRIHVRGIVTSCQPGSFVWIRDGASGLRIQTDQRETLLPGDEIDVLGFPSYGSYIPVLENSVFRKTGSTQSPAPLAFTNYSEAFDHEDDLVATEAMLTQIQPVLDGVAFTLDMGGKIFKAVLKLPSNELLHPDWQTGSKVRITGICSLVHDETRPMAGIWQPQSFQILLRSPADLNSLTPPPWWTSGHIALLLGVVSGALLLVTGVVTLLARRRLNEQRHQRAMAEAEFAAILSERNRMAREIHDTLAQGLVATSVQLRLAKKQTAGASEALNQYLDTAQQLVSGSLEEARNSIWNMRSQVLENGDLVSALKGILKQMADGTEVETRFEVVGQSRRLAPVIESNLLRVGQEAVTNATKHARAKHISVRLEFGEKQFRLVVADDGRGFDPSVSLPGAGGFGLLGMRERATQLNGELTIHSAPGQGAEISLSIPLSSE
jgi:signal transduction histidine kinase